MAKTPRILTIATTTAYPIPVGSVMHFSASTPPSGYLVCDGSEISQTAFSALYSVIGSTYNTQINPTTGTAWTAPQSGNFRLPDYRGVFLRGVGTNNLGVATTLGGWQDNATAKNGMSVSNGSYSLNGAAPALSGTPPSLVGAPPSLSGIAATLSGSAATLSGSAPSLTGTAPTLTNSTVASSAHSHNLSKTTGSPLIVQTVGTGSALKYINTSADTSGQYNATTDNTPTTTTVSISGGSYALTGGNYTLTGGAYSLTGGNYSLTGGAYSISGGSYNISGGSYSLSGSAPTLGAGDTETRPQNKGVYYIIKF